MQDKGALVLGAVALSGGLIILLGLSGMAQAQDLAACQGPGQDVTTAGMVACLSEDARHWEAQMKALWPGVVAMARASDADGMPGGAEAALAEAQRSWLDHRLAECRWIEAQADGGSLGRVLAAACMRDKTAERVADFRDWLRQDTP